MTKTAALLLSAITFCLLVGCKKITAKKLSGIYIGTVREYNETPYTAPTDNIELGSFVVSRDGKTVNACGVSIHQDSLLDGFYSYPNPSGQGGIRSIQIKEDSVIVFNYSKYKFGYVQFSEYRGIKD